MHDLVPLLAQCLLDSLVTLQTFAWQLKPQHGRRMQAYALALSLTELVLR